MHLENTQICTKSFSLLLSQFHKKRKERTCVLAFPNCRSFLWKWFLWHQIPAYHFHHFTLILVIVTASTTPQLNSVMSTPDPLLRLLAVRHHTLVASHSMSAWGHIWVIQCYYSQDLFNSSTHSSWRTVWDFHSYQIIFLSIKTIRAVFQDVSHKRRS